MIPAFDENGNLPPGVYPATFEEIAARFGWQSEIRHAKMESLGWLVPLAKRAGVKRLHVRACYRNLPARIKIGHAPRARH